MNGRDTENWPIFAGPVTGILSKTVPSSKVKEKVFPLLHSFCLRMLTWRGLKKITEKHITQNSRLTGKALHIDWSQTLTSANSPRIISDVRHVRKLSKYRVIVYFFILFDNQYLNYHLPSNIFVNSFFATTLTLSLSVSLSLCLSLSLPCNFIFQSLPVS